MRIGALIYMFLGDRKEHICSGSRFMKAWYLIVGKILLAQRVF